jgi:hypothetical protein
MRRVVAIVDADERVVWVLRLRFHFRSRSSRVPVVSSFYPSSSLMVADKIQL